MSKEVKIIPISSYYRWEFSNYPTINKFIKRCDDIDCWYVEETQLSKLFHELNFLLEINDYDLCFYSLIHSFINFIGYQKEFNKCLAINRC